MNREQLVKALVARKLTGEKNKRFCVCMAGNQQRVVCMAAAGRSPAGKQS